MNLKGKIPLVLWALYLIVQPFYLFPKGLPQLSDALALLIFGALFLRDGVGGVAKVPAIRWMGIFALWVTIVSVCWMVILELSGETGDHRIRIWYFPLFYLFNLIFLTGMVALYRRYGAEVMKWTFWGVVVSISIQAFASLGVGFHAYQRSRLFFENANQLGYYALLSATIITLAGRRSGAPVLIMVAALLGALYLNTLSLSKSAGVGVALLLVFVFLRRPTVILALAAFMYGALQLGVLEELIERVTWRMGGFGLDADDTMEGRGYDRIWLFPQYLFVGAGEGATQRFGLGFHGELHSSVGTLLFSYGIVGVALFGRLVLALISKVPRFDLLPLLPVAMYGVTHQGLRFRPFWVVLGVICWIGLEQSRAHQAKARAQHAQAQAHLRLRLAPPPAPASPPAPATAGTSASASVLALATSASTPSAPSYTKRSG